MKTLLPEGWPRPRGYANGMLADGETVFVAGMIGWDSDGKFADGLVDQFALTLENTVAVLAEADAVPDHIVRMTWYVTDMQAYRDNIKDIGSAYRRIIGQHGQHCARNGWYVAARRSNSDGREEDGRAAA